MSRTRFNLMDFNLAPGFRVIEAGAGSGKTYNLIRIVLRLLTREQSPLPIQKILLVTFTEAAALEMRQRLRSILEEALKSELKGDLAKIVATVRDRRRVQRALDDLGSMQVTTIHGFCLRAYADHAVNCGFSPLPGDPQDGVALLAEIAADWFRTKPNLDVKLSVVTAATKALVMSPDAVLPEELEDLRIYVKQRLDGATVVTFDHLIKRLQGALQDETKGKELCKALQKDYGACLIDESQDTDASQWEIFDRLFGPYANTGQHFLLMVGDPKQAIYGFRGANLQTYCSAVKQADQVLTLPDNFRSSPEMIEAFNALFGRSGFFATSEITYDTAGSGKAQIAELDGLPFEVVHSEEPAAVAREAIRLLREMDQAQIRVDGTIGPVNEHVGPSQVGVLVRSNRDADKIYRALVAGGQGASLESRQSVFETTTAFQVQLLLRAVLRPSHAGNRKALILSRPSLFGESAKLDEDTDNAIGRWLNQCLTLWRKQGFALAWEALTRRAPAKGLLSVVEGLGRCQFRHRALMDLSHVGELLITRTRTLHWTPEQLFEHLTARVRGEHDGEVGESDASEDECLRPDSANSRIVVRTIHKSKGLEYNAVILAKAFTYGKDPIRAGTILRGSEGVSTIFTGDRDDENDDSDESTDGGDTTRAGLEIQQRQEDARLLYVALTRARHRFVWMGVGVPPKTRSSTPKDQAPKGFSKILDDVKLDSSLRSESLPPEIKPLIQHSEPLKADDPRAKPLPSPAFNLALAKIPQRLPMAYGVTSYSGLSKGKHEVSTTTSGFEDPDDPKDSAPAVDLLVPDSLKGNQLGNLLHKLMELLDFNRATQDRPYLETMIRELLTESSLVVLTDPAFDETVQTLTQSALVWLQQPLRTHAGKPFSLIDIDAAKQLAEVRFSFAASVDEKTFPALDAAFAEEFNPAGKSALAELGLSWDRGNPLEGLVTGSVDFVFAQDGRYYIVDWKSNFIGETSSHYLSENIAKSIAKECYHLQFSLYTIALDAHLSRCLGDQWNYERDFGGVYYIYLRGFGTHPDGTNGAFFHRPSAKFVQRIRSILQPDPVQS